ncbi:HD domain-containing protein [Patescibacteria group bacterium]|nr:HD domain-containing protein [Patescibacteria group bacterium]
MKNILNFLINVGKLKKIKRKGVMLYGVKDPETTAAHTFRMAIMTWILGEKKKLNIEKAIKMVLVHDLCEVYAGDITPYDGILPKNTKERYEFVRKWPRFSKKEKKKRQAKKFKREKESLEKLIKELPEKVRKEIMDLWVEYEKGITKEGRFVRQMDRAENLLEAFELWKRDNKFPTKPWWQHTDEVIDDPVILEFLKEIEKEELAENKK